MLSTLHWLLSPQRYLCQIVSPTPMGALHSTLTSAGKVIISTSEMGDAPCSRPWSPLSALVSTPLFKTCCPSLLQTYLSYVTALLKIYTSSPSSRHGSPFSLGIQLSFIKSKPVLPSLCPKIHLLILAKTYQQWSTISTSKESI
jgi:hypothetical protein